MKNSFKYIALILSALHLSSCAGNNYDSDNQFQNSERAVRYFADELNFTTNPVGVRSVMSQRDEKITIVDVRSQEDYMSAHIPGSINLPYDKWNKFEGNETEFPGLRRDGYNIVYCYQPLCNLSQKAALKFASLGYPVKEMLGGFDSWKKYKFPIQR